MEDALPEWIVCSGYLKEFSPGPVQFSAECMGIFPKSAVGWQYLILSEIKPNTKNAPPQHFLVIGWYALGLIGSPKVVAKLKTIFFGNLVNF